MLFFFIIILYFFYLSLLFELYGLFLVRRRAWHVAENEENKLKFFLANKFVIFFIMNSYSLCIYLVKLFILSFKYFFPPIMLSGSSSSGPPGGGDAPSRGFPSTNYDDRAALWRQSGAALPGYGKS